MARFAWILPVAAAAVAVGGYLFIRLQPEPAVPLEVAVQAPAVEPTTPLPGGPVLPAAPVAAQKPHTLTLNGIERSDPYYWLKDKKNPEVIAYLEAENGYAEAALAPLKPQVDALYAEMADRIDDAERSVPYRKGGYFYSEDFAEGADYPVISRRKGTLEAAPEIVLDEPLLAKGHEQFNLNNWIVSPDGSRVAYAVDFAGGRLHTIFVAEIATGKIIESTVKGAASDLAWSADGKTLFYVKADPVTVREYQVWRHVVGGDPASDVLVFEERDDIYSVGLRSSTSEKYILISSTHLQSTEVRFVPADKPDSELRIIAPRVGGLRYFVDHVGSSFYILTNLNAPDYRIVKAGEDNPGPSQWSDVVPEAPGHYIGGFQVFDSFIAYDAEHDANTYLHIVRLDTGAAVDVPRPAEIGVMSMGDFGDAVNVDPSLPTVRFGFSAPASPPAIYDYNVMTGALTLLKEDPAKRWFKPELYAVERIVAPLDNGDPVPVTLIYRKDMRVPGGNPALLQGYGAYGISNSPDFRATWISLADRGFVLAYAHIRGGRERGQGWYDDGRMAHKINSFTDFIAAGEVLIAKGYADPKRLFARGGSAGGLLMGGVVNMRPDLFNGVIAEVPFVDVITTMSDPTIPLTTFEYEEWGNPEIRENYEWMIAYSPYDNVSAKAYPALFVTAGLNDSQVGYFEPAKWVARLRERNTGKNPILFMTEMDAGHGGDSGRLGFLQERAKIMAWIADRAGIKVEAAGPPSASQ
ncbi:MAG: S9 family peptidase [Alphaproteobacteria bacterium]|nr:S9 family peptidase [Alphaproteobacteria bacterium]